MTFDVNLFTIKYMGNDTPNTAARTPRRFISKTKTGADSAFSATPEESVQENKQANFFRQQRVRFHQIDPLKLTFVALAVVSVGAFGTAAYSYHMYKQSEKQVIALQNKKETAKLEADKTIAAVRKLIILPKDETPTIATVTDSKKLKSQSFFSKASNGDKVLIYTKAKKAILFNPTQNVVVEVAPVNLGKNTKAEVAGAAVTPSQPLQIPTPTTVTQVQPITTNPPIQPTTAPTQ